MIFIIKICYYLYKLKIYIIKAKLVISYIIYFLLIEICL